MKTNLFAATLAAFALAALLGVLLPSDSAVYAAPPMFDTDPDPRTRTIPENTPSGVNIGAPISATDPDETGDDALEFGNTLTYKLGGTDAASFDIDPSTGQLITRAPLDAEGKNSYSVMVTVTDSETPANTVQQLVTIDVTDVAGTEAPLAPAAPTVVSTGEDNTDTDDVDESTTSLKVVWHPPDNAGRPNITTYAVQYKKSVDTSFGIENLDHTFPATNATITGLEADTSYDVRVRATNSDDTGPWSFVGTGSTNKKGNSPPSFNEDRFTGRTGCG